MKTIPFLLRTLGLVAVSAGLLACGGGGGGGDNGGSGGPGAPANTLVITKDNAVEVAGVVGGTVDSLTGGADAVTAVAPFSTSNGVPSAPTIADGSGILGFAWDMAREYGNAPTSAMSSTLRAVRNTFREDCSQGGSVQFEAVDNDDNGVTSAGDSVSLTFSNCIEPDGTANGSATLTVNAWNGNPDVEGATWNIQMTIAFNNLQFTDTMQGLDSALNGTMILTGDSEGIVESGSFAMTNMSFTANGESVNVSSLKVEFEHNTNTQIERVSINGTITHSVIGTFTIETVTPLESYDSEDNPHSGEIRINGAQSSMTLVAMSDGATVTIEVDENGDGVVDETLTVTWTELDNA